jgi:recombinational DNA repair protein RecR
MIRILLLQGANMEWLGYRQPELYGTATAGDLDAMMQGEAAARSVQLDIRYTNLEGEATAAYLQREIVPLGARITRLARGLPTGGDLEWADVHTLTSALEGRRELH